MREDEASLQEHFGEIAEAQFVAEAPEHDQQDDVRRGLKEVEGGAGALIEAAPTRATTESLVTQRGGLGLGIGQPIRRSGGQPTRLTRPLPSRILTLP